MSPPAPQATSPGTEGFCQPGGDTEDRSKLCCVCLEEDPSWCGEHYKSCSWGKQFNWDQRKKGVREAAMLRSGVELKGTLSDVERTNI